MTEKQTQAGRDEHSARADNELVSVDGEQAGLLGGALLAVLCECADDSCHKPIIMTVDQYETIRSKPAQFAVLAGHEVLSVERVTATSSEYLTVEKFGDAGREAIASDPRNHQKICRVVIVDDIPEIRYLLKMLMVIEASCSVVGEAGNGVDAISIIELTQPEVVVLDLEMPVMDGWHALPLIRSIAPSSHIIVFSSTQVDTRLEKRLINLGANRFVRKGGDPKIIVDAIRDVSLSGRDRTFAQLDDAT